ncbi:craniofacial development protein 2 isoform X1 [Zeugodacus cucurbitae]|uniref:craniofacial development protein 2 isoform X1 n=1 Tax=Zeugodacus cucurbitae TaxID=28588 RepID=UPI0023D931FF|nr:craniofacial development protein 2 isoform X1 [Zeugodacus cucurbitae]XP_054082832.1 craniofacial development protein 2 isoform X1 [Zeugodacus cucurbitae]
MKNLRKPRMRHPPFDDDPCTRFKDNALRVCTWNVRTLNWEGASVQLADVLIRLKADITAIQAVRWTGHGRKKVGPCDIYYSGHIKERKFGVGFVVGERLRRRVLAFTPVDERLATIRIKARFFNITLICAHAPTEEKDDVTKDAFYERLERTYERCPRHDVKVVLGDFNARVGKEGVFGTTAGKFSLHDETSPNGLRLIDFAGARNMVVCSTRFQHKKIHQATWLSPDRNTRNQIDHVVIDGRHVSCVLDVRTLRGPNIDSDHYLVAAKIRTRLCAAKNARQQTQGRFDVEKLQSQQTATKYSTRLALLLSESTHQHLGIRELWNGISNSLRTAAVETIGFRQRQKTSWYDEECRLASERKQTSYLATLQTTTTRAGWDRYRELKREARRICRQKKKEAEMREYEELEKLADRRNARKFYEKRSDLTKVSRPEHPHVETKVVIW